jgi:hypothetical protein
MEFKEVFEALKQGKKVKRAHWAGYWQIVDNNNVMFCKDGKQIPFTQTEDVMFTVSNMCENDWEIANDDYSHELVHTFTFGEAIRKLKNGKRVARLGWNGKGMYLWLMPAATVKAEWCKEPHLHALAEANGGEIEALGSIRMLTADKKILTGWLASQTDVLAEDWIEVD